MFPAAPGDPDGWRVWIGKEVLVDQQVFVGERGERFAQLDDRPEQQPFGFLAIVLEGRFRIGESGEPCSKRFEVVRCRNLRLATGGPVGAVSPVERGREDQRVKRRGHDGQGGDSGFGHGKGEA
jgi:hypothetical protein